jgi:hypothetical protein
VWAGSPSTSESLSQTRWDAVAGLVGGLGLGAALGERLGGAFPAGLAGGSLTGCALADLLLATVGGHAEMLLHPLPHRHPKVKASNNPRGRLH